MQIHTGPRCPHPHQDHRCRVAVLNLMVATPRPGSVVDARLREVGQVPEHATVDGDGDPGDVARVVGGEEGHGVRDVLWGTDSRPQIVAGPLRKLLPPPRRTGTLGPRYARGS